VVRLVECLERMRACWKHPRQKILLNWRTNPPPADSGINLIRAAEMHLDRLSHLQNLTEPQYHDSSMRDHLRIGFLQILKCPLKSVLAFPPLAIASNLIEVPFPQF